MKLGEKQYCLSCRAPNELAAISCAKCGAGLEANPDPLPPELALQLEQIRRENEGAPNSSQSPFRTFWIRFVAVPWLIGWGFYYIVTKEARLEELSIYGTDAVWFGISSIGMAITAFAVYGKQPRGKTCEFIRTTAITLGLIAFIAGYLIALLRNL